MTILARHSAGRILLHLLAMLGDRCVRFHFEGTLRELPSITSGLAMLTRMRGRLLAAVTLHLAQPIKQSTANRDSGPQSLAAVLHRGDVLLTQGNSRFAAVIKRLSRSAWSHVSMYVGPLDQGPDHLWIVEADIAAGVRSIRLSDLNALRVRLLRPIGRTEPETSLSNLLQPLPWRFGPCRLTARAVSRLSFSSRAKRATAEPEVRETPIQSSRAHFRKYGATRLGHHCSSRTCARRYQGDRRDILRLERCRFDRMRLPDVLVDNDSDPAKPRPADEN